MRAGPERSLTEPFPRRPKWQTWVLFSGLTAAFTATAVFSPFHDRFYLPIGILSLALASGLLISSWIDLDRYILPDIVTLPLIGLGLVAALLLEQSFIGHLVGAIAGYGLILMLTSLWRIYRGQDGIGLGDAKLLAAGGAWVGILNLPIILLIASGTGIFVALILRLRVQSENGRIIPFGPLLSLGIWFSWCVPFQAFL